MTKQLLGYLIVFNSAVVLGQSGASEFGSVTKEELLMKSHPIDTSAGALILFDVGEAEVDPTYSVVGTSVKRHFRIKIFKKSAFEEWGTVKMWVDRGGLSKLRGRTYNLENGNVEVTEMEKGAVFKDKSAKSFQQISLAFPNVRVGSVIELAYTENNGAIYFPSWQFQQTIPTLWSEYSVITARTNYSYHIQGTLPLTSHEQTHEGKRQHWLMKNVPAFKTEELMPNKNAYMSSLVFSRKGWFNIHFQLVEHGSFLKTVNGHDYLKQKVDSLITGLELPLQKVKAISDYVKNKVTWNGTNDFLSDVPKKVLQKGQGTSGDINLLLGSMLQKAGFDVNLALLSTRDHGFVSENLPSLSQFNYVVCLVTIDSLDLLFDATEKLLPFDVLPERCFNHKGLFISERDFGWIGIEPDKKKKTVVNGSLSLAEDGGLTGKISITLDGYAGFHFRSTNNTSETPYIRTLLTPAQWTLEKTSESGLAKIESPVVLDYNVDLDDHAIATTDVLLFNPYLFLREELNPFVAESRIYPIDFGDLVEKVVILSITIPENYVIEELPGNKILSVPGNSAKAVFNLTSTGNRILLTTHLQINKTLFMQNEYPNLREFYSRLIAKKNENIVLKKKP
jgi:Domain of Unknown Function with PDB structure (DUF3857)